MAPKTPAKRPSAPPPTAPAATEKPGLPAIPGFQWKNIAVIGGVVGILWLTALATGSKWFIIAVGILTLVVAGGIAYVYRWARKQRQMLELLQGAAASPAARREALAKLEAQSGSDKDGMNAFARAQLEAQDDPEKALGTLEAIDLGKLAGPIADQVRAFRAQLYLVFGRSREAREMADKITLTNAGEADARAMFAAVVAEAWSRTGKHKEALDLLQTIKPEDPDYKAAKVPLLFARVYASFASGQRENVKRDMGALLREDMNLLGRFVAPKAKVPPELQKIAKDVLQRSPEVRKMMLKQSRASRRR